MSKKAKWVAFPVKFDESAGVTWNPEHTRIMSVDYEKLMSAMHKAMSKFHRQLRKMDRAHTNEVNCGS